MLLYMLYQFGSVKLFFVFKLGLLFFMSLVLSLVVNKYFYSSLLVICLHDVAIDTVSLLSVEYHRCLV